MIRRIAYAIAAIAGIQTQATAATITPYEVRDGSRVLSISGPLEQGDDARLQAQFDVADKLGIQFLVVALSSPGGEVTAGWGMAKIIRSRGLSTVVTKSKECMSACFYLFAAGVQRFAGEYAKIGVHSAAINGVENDRTKALTKLSINPLFTRIHRDFPRKACMK